MGKLHKYSLVILTFISCFLLSSCGPDLSGLLSPTAFYITSIHMISDQDGWAVGSLTGKRESKVLHYDGSSWKVAQPQPQLSADDEIWSVDATQSQVWLAGQVAEAQHGETQNFIGVIYHFDGNTWGRETFPKPLYAITMLSPDEGWAAGSEGEVIHFLHNQWQNVPAMTTNNLNCVAFTSPDNGWAAGGDGEILHYNGRDWEHTSHLTHEVLQAISLPDTSSGWIVGTNGTILSFDGTAWGEVTSPTDKILRGVTFSSADNGWAAGDSGTLLQYSNGLWQQVQSPIQDQVNTISASANEVWAGTNAATPQMFHYQNGTWSMVSLSVS